MSGLTPADADTIAGALAGEWVQAHTGDPGAAGTANSPGAARQMATWGVTGDGARAITSHPQWAWGPIAAVITHISVWDTGTGGSFRLSVKLATQVSVPAGGTFTLTSLSLAVTPVLPPGPPPGTGEGAATLALTAALSPAGTGGGGGGAAGTLVFFSDVQSGGAAGACHSMLMGLSPQPDYYVNGGDDVNSGSMAGFDSLWGATWRAGKMKPVHGSNTHVSLATWTAYYKISPAWYSFKLAGWLCLVLDYNQASGAGSAQYTWAQGQFAANPTTPTILFWHCPRYSAGSRHHGGGGMTSIFSLAYGQAHRQVELHVSGHVHCYERYPRMDASGGVDAVNGIRCLVASNAGMTYTNTESGMPPPDVWSTANTTGGLRLKLFADRYTWEWLPIAGSAALHGAVSTTTDSGTQMIRNPVSSSGLSITTTSPPAGKVGTGYNYQLQVAGATGDVVWTYTGG